MGIGNYYIAVDVRLCYMLCIVLCLIAYVWFYYSAEILPNRKWGSMRHS